VNVHHDTFMIHQPCLCLQMRAVEGTDSRPELPRVPPGAQQEAPAAPLHRQQQQPQSVWTALNGASKVRVPGDAPHCGPAQTWQQAQYSHHQQQQLQASALRWQQEQLFMAARGPHTQLHVHDTQPQRQHGNHPRNDVQNKMSALEAMTAAPPLQAPAHQAFKPVRVAGVTSTQTSAIARCVGPRSICTPHLRPSSCSNMFRECHQAVCENTGFHTRRTACARGCRRLRAASLPVPATPNQAPVDRRQVPRRLAGAPTALGQRQCGMAAILTGPVRCVLSSVPSKRRCDAQARSVVAAHASCMHLSDEVFISLGAS